MIIGEEVQIESSDYWFKVVGFLQQNWALIDKTGESVVKIFFISDLSEVFDELDFKSTDEAIEALVQNGFKRYSEDEAVQEFLAKPMPPFHRQHHSNGEIYSSGRYWI